MITWAVLDEVVKDKSYDEDARLGRDNTEAAVKAPLDAKKQPVALPASNIVVRIQGEGQFRLASSYKHQLDGFDKKVVAAIDAGQPASLKQSVHDVIAFVKSHGLAVPDSDGVASQVVLPSEDLTLDEAKKIMAGG